MSYALEGITFLPPCSTVVLLMCQVEVPALFSGGSAGPPFAAVSLLLARVPAVLLLHLKNKPFDLPFDVA